jgi:hypothetical protein
LSEDPGNATTISQGKVSSSGIVTPAAYISQQPFTVPTPFEGNADSQVEQTNPYPMIALPFGPIVYASLNSKTTGVPGGDELSLVSTNWKPITSTGFQTVGTPTPTSNSNEAATLVDGEYAIDTSDSPNGYQVAFPVANYPQTFNISYTVGGAVNSASITLPAGAIQYTGIADTVGANGYFNPTGSYEGYWDSLQDLILEYGTGSASATWDLGSLQICRPLAPIPAPANLTTNPFGSDPYEYYVDSNDDVYTSSSGNINLGVLRFNPLAAPDQLKHPLKLLISYPVYSWSILHEDDTLSRSSDSVNLAVGDIMQPGQVQTDPVNGQTVTSYLFPGTNYSIVGMDLDTGVQFSGSSDYFTMGNPGDFLKGHIELTDGIGLQHPHMRFYYATADSLNVGMQKAPAQFLAVPTGNSEATDLGLLTASSTPTTNYYYIDQTIDTAANAYQIQFPLTCAGQTVVLENVTWYDTSGVAHTIPNVTVNISEPATTGPDSSTAYADVTNILSNAAYSAGLSLASPSNANGFAVAGVGSQSARAVCIWKESGNWKIHNVDTILQ